MNVRWMLPLLAIPCVMGCAALPTNLETPEVSFVGLKAVEASVFEQRLEVRMKVRNPNSIELPVNGLDVNVDLAGEPFAHGVSTREFVVPAGGEAEFDMLVTANAATALLKIAGSERKTDERDHFPHHDFSPRTACAADNLAIGTRNGEHDT